MVGRAVLTEVEVDGCVGRDTAVVVRGKVVVSREVIVDGSGVVADDVGSFVVDDIVTVVKGAAVIVEAVNVVRIEEGVVDVSAVVSNMVWDWLDTAVVVDVVKAVVTELAVSELVKMLTDGVVLLVAEVGVIVTSRLTFIKDLPAIIGC